MPVLSGIAQFRVEGTGLEVISVPAAPLIARFLSSGVGAVSSDLSDQSLKSANPKFIHLTAQHSE